MSVIYSFLHPADSENKKLLQWLCKEEIRCCCFIYLSSMKALIYVDYVIVHLSYEFIVSFLCPCQAVVHNVFLNLVYLVFNIDFFCFDCVGSSINHVSSIFFLNHS